MNQPHLRSYLHKGLLPVLVLLLLLPPAARSHAAADSAPAPSTTAAASAEPTAASIQAITAAGLLEHIKVLASDEFEGRAPGTPGEEKSIAYITGQFKKLGLKPGNPNGTYVQEVPLAGIKSTPALSFVVGSKTTALRCPDDFVAGSERLLPEIKEDNTGVVFVGYGVVAPEYGWDDYKDMDVRGKTILMLINDPAIPDPHDPSKLDDAMFKGKAMTYYGRWTYKYEIAAKKGAAAAIIIHETGPAAYQYSVVKTSWNKENFALDAPDKNMGAVPVYSWINVDVAKQLCTDSGHNFEDLKKAALSKDFRPIEMGVKATFDIKQAVRTFTSHNVVGALPGSDPKLADEWVLFTAHWDHLGHRPELPGDNIFNGAVDNASGVATVLEIAQAFRAAEPGPKRSILFMATTAEEAGLLGAKYYGEHPLYPLTKTLADLNVDGMGVHGKTADVEDTSNGYSTLDDQLEAATQRQGRTLKPNSRPENGGFYRADHFEFARHGVPSLYLKYGVNLIGQPAGLGDQLETEWIVKNYHRPSDEVRADWNLSGAEQDAQLLYEVGWEVANEDKFPEWKPGTEFKGKRDAMMSGAGK